jgi:hypothetical protein
MGFTLPLPPPPPPCNDYRRIAVSAGRKWVRTQIRRQQKAVGLLSYIFPLRVTVREVEEAREVVVVLGKVPQYLALCFRQLTGTGRWGSLGLGV